MLKKIAYKKKHNAEFLLNVRQCSLKEVKKFLESAEKDLLDNEEVFNLVAII